MKIFNRMTGVLVAFVMAFQLTVSAAEKVNNPSLDIAGSGTYQMVDGTFVFEAEDMTYRKTMALVATSEASGGYALRTNTDFRQVYDPNAEPEAYIDFVSDTSETVYLWFRVKTTNGNADSIFYNLGGNEYMAKHFSSELLEDPQVYYWRYITAFENFEEGKAIRFNIQQRERDFFLDKVVFTTDINFSPVNMDDVPGTANADYSDLYNEPPVKPIEGHPRVFFTKDDIPEIIENIQTDEMRSVYLQTVQAGDKEINPTLDTSLKRNYNYALIENLVSRALLYALGLRDEAYGRVAVENMLEYIRTVRFNLSLGDETRAVGATMTMAGCVYDWCYDLMTDDEKAYTIRRLKALARQTEVGYPPSALTSISGHTGEGEVFAYPLLCGIAIYDEDPEMYNLAAGRIFDEMAEARNLWLSSGAHNVGNDYGGGTRFAWELFAELLFSGIDSEGVLATNEQLVNTTKTFMHYRLPTGSTFKIGDSYSWAAWEPRTWWRTYKLIFEEMAAMSDDPYVRQASLVDKSILGNTTTYNNVVPDLIAAQPNKETKMFDSLPLVNKTNYPFTSIQARTNWTMGIDSNAAVVDFEAREKLPGDTHAHADFGSFQIYYKGYLTGQTGLYQGKGGAWGSTHYWNYSSRTISNNCMTVFDPNDTSFGNQSNDGGQNMITAYDKFEDYIAQEDPAVTDAYYIGPNEETPEFSFVKTNLTNAYGEKVQNHERSMVFMDLDNDDYPAAVVVFDDVTSSDKSFRKAWLLHSLYEPEISGNTSVIKRDDNGYNGKLVNVTMLPEEPDITTVGGEGNEYLVNGTNYPNADYDTAEPESAGWRIEVSPSKENTRDYFLNSMYVTDCDGDLPQLPMYQEETSSLIGVTVMDRAVYFAKESQINGSQVINVRNNGYDEVKILITDIKPGIWKVTGADGISKNYEVKEGENSLYFRTVPGNCTVSLATEGTADEITYEKMDKPTYGDFMVYSPARKQFLAITEPTVIENGVKLVPAVQTCRQLGAEATEENGVLTVTRGDDVQVFTSGSTSGVFNTSPVALKTAPVMKNGIMYINPEDLMYSVVEYDDAARIMKIRIGEYSSYTALNYTNALIPKKVYSTVNGETLIGNICDGDFSTVWKAEGAGLEAVFELDEISYISGMDFYPDDGAGSTVYADITVSTNGVDFAPIYSGEITASDDGTVKADFPFDVSAKYISVTFNGNKNNLKNAIKEIIIYGGE